MNTTPSVVRDERTEVVENASYKWSYFLITYALLIDVAYRGIVRHEAAWDLLAMVILSGGVGALYQARQKTLPQDWAKKGLIVALVAGVIGFIVATVLAMTQAK